MAMLLVGVAGAALAYWSLYEPPVKLMYAISNGGRDHTTKHFKYFISVNQTSGNADRVEVTVDFQGPVNVYNSWLHAADGHALSCDVVPVGLHCRLDGSGESFIAVTTDSLMMPVLTSSDERVRLRSAAEGPETPPLDVLIAAVAVLTFIVVMYRTRSRRPLPVFRGRHW